MPSNKFGNEYRDIRSLSKFGYNSTIKSGDIIDLDTYVTTVVSSSTSGDVNIVQLLPALTTPLFVWTGQQAKQFKDQV